MKIEELISGKNDNEEVVIEGLEIPVAALKNLMKDGYENVRPYPENQTISLWGKNCTACFTLAQLKERAGM